MRDQPWNVKTEPQVPQEPEIVRRDAWLFAPLAIIATALPLGIVAVLSASVWFATHSGSDRYDVASFASRFNNVYTR
jgi:hypothetical protein